MSLIFSVIACIAIMALNTLHAMELASKIPAPLKQQDTFNHCIIARPLPQSKGISVFYPESANPINNSQEILCYNNAGNIRTIKHAKFTADINVLVILGDDQCLMLWTLKPLQIIKIYSELSIQKKTITALTLNNSRSQIALGSADGNVYIFAATTLELLNQYKPSKGKIRKIIFSTNNLLIGAITKNTIFIWQAHNGIFYIICKIRFEYNQGQISIIPKPAKFLLNNPEITYHLSVHLKSEANSTRSCLQSWTVSAKHIVIACMCDIATKKILLALPENQRFTMYLN